jgi:hypothetical protein
MEVNDNGKKVASAAVVVALGVRNHQLIQMAARRQWNEIEIRHV